MPVSRYRCIFLAALAALCAGPPALAAERSTDAFLQDALELKAKGPLALFSGKVKPLMAEGQAAGYAARDMRAAGLKRGEKPLYCPPAKATMGQTEMLDGLARIPRAERQRLPLTMGMLRVMQAKWPCK